MKVIIRRFLEFFIIEALLSAVFTWLFNFAWEPAVNAVVICSLCGIAFYIIIQVAMLRRCYLDLKNPFFYCVFNYTAYALVIAVNFIFVFSLKAEVYTYFYFILKILYFANPTVDSFFSALLFHFFMLIVIFIAPIGLDKSLIQMDLFDELNVTENYGMTEDYVITETEGKVDETQ